MRIAISHDTTYFGRSKKAAIVTMPLHDRNGEVVGAVRITMESFRGQTEQNVLARANDRPATLLWLGGRAKAFKPFLDEGIEGGNHCL